jgi:peptide/nickel transport system substrate-binding protein
MRLARRYLRRSGVRPGRARPLLIVGDGTQPDRGTAITVNKTVRRLGFRTRLRLVSRADMFVRFCNRPAARVAICPSVGWSADFTDPEAMLRPIFKGDEIRSRSNVNWSQLSVPAIDRAMDAAATIAAAPRRAAAWAAIDRQIVAQAAGAPYIWDRVGQYASRDLDAAINPYTTVWDLSFTGLR